jgi:hypothetical protein
LATLGSTTPPVEPPLPEKVAVQLFAASIDTTVEALVPVQLPPQLVKVAPALGVAVKRTILPLV